MLLGNLLKNVSKNYQKTNINNICFDSREIKKDDVFFAIDGNNISGNKFIHDAISGGASAIITNKKIEIKNSNIPFVQVKDVRKTLSEACSKFFNKKPKNIVAVTGTNGKSSVADFYYQILSYNNVPAASIGTLGIISKNYYKKTNLTSMDPISLHKNLNNLAKNGIKNVILEASSHGLAQKRLDSLNFNIGIFTNLSHDHLDYHKNIKSYFNAKMRLFNKLLKKRNIIITDEKNNEFKTLKQISRKRKLKKITIGENSGNLKILYHKYKKDTQIVKISIDSKVFLLEIPLIGFFQVKNLLMAALAAMYSGLTSESIFSKINKIKAVPGRLENVASLKNNSNIIVDFAHTPEALEQSLISIKKQFKKEIVIVFGCGGERDKKKRIKMGKIAKKYCKKIFITDDNPRRENPKKIRNVIMKGCKGSAIDIGNRKRAIETAIKELKSNEILLVAGKGHEKTQDYGNKIINFSDKEVIKKLIKRKKFTFKKNYWSNFLARKAFKNNYRKNLNYEGVSINTKTMKKNNLFFAIKGQNTDGHKFAKEAIKKGAIKLIVSKKLKKISKSKMIIVKNTLSSLNNLAKITRNNTDAQIIGITGSVGKTTLKNLIGFVLGKYGKIYYSPHSYNNKFGVPLSLSNLKNEIDYGVFEIGMDKKGEIGRLSKIVKPELAIITNISEAHFKNFKTLKDIARAKSEIIENIVKGGNLILNRDGDFYSFLSNRAKKRGVNVTSFGSRKKSDIFLLNIKKINRYFRLKVSVKGKIYYFFSKYDAESYINNILACVTVMFTLNLNLKKIKRIFIKFKIPEGRGDIKKVKKFNKRFNFIDESYNANPLSMRSAINNINLHKTKKNRKKLVFLGDMLELGKRAKILHKSLARTINKSDIDKVFVYGKYIRETFYSLSSAKKGKIFNNLKEANNHFSEILRNNDLLMIKGSNATGLNQFSKNIKKDQVSVI